MTAPGPAAPPALVDQGAQRLEQFRRAMDLVQDDQPVLIGGEEKLGVRQLSAVRRRFQVEVERPGVFSDVERQRRLADLTRPDQSHRSLPIKRPPNGGAGASGDHPCKLKTFFWICKDEVKQTIMIVRRTTLAEGAGDNDAYGCKICIILP